MRGSTCTYIAAIATIIAIIENGVTVDAASGEVCTEKVCLREGGSQKCDRSKKICPPCLHERKKFIFMTEIVCVSAGDDGACPDNTVWCPPFGDSSSFNGAPELPTSGPTLAPIVSNWSSGLSAGGSKPSNTTNKQLPTTVTPSPDPTASTPATSKPATSKPIPLEQNQVTDSPFDAKSTTTSSSSSKMPMIVGITVSIAVLVAAVMFFIWRRRRDDYDSDDEGEVSYNPPKRAQAFSYNPPLPPNISPPPAYNATMSTNSIRPDSTTSSTTQNKLRSHTAVGAGVMGIGSSLPAPEDSQHSLNPDNLNPKQRASGGSVDSDRDVWGNTRVKKRRTSSSGSIEF